MFRLLNRRPICTQHSQTLKSFQQSLPHSGSKSSTTRLMIKMSAGVHGILRSIANLDHALEFICGGSRAVSISLYVCYLHLLNQSLHTLFETRRSPLYVVGRESASSDSMYLKARMHTNYDSAAPNG